MGYTICDPSACVEECNCACSCVVEKLYDFICRDEKTACGGLEPCKTDFHEDGFWRAPFDETFDNQASSGIDRRVMIMYLGSSESIAEATSPNTYVVAKNYQIIVGYYAGDHISHTMSVIDSDDSLLQTAVHFFNCEFMASPIVVLGSTVEALDQQRYQLTIDFQIDVRSAIFEIEN